MKGHIFERPKGSGRWAIMIDLPREPGAKRRQKFITVRGTKRDAQHALHKLIAQRETLPRPGKLTVDQFLTTWVADQRVGAKSRERYAEIIHKNLIPGLGHIVLNKLTGDDISRHYTNALKNGRVNGKGGLAPRTVKYQHILLGKALRHAVRKALLVRNPIDGVAPPHVERPRIRPLDLSQSAQMLDKARGTRLFIPLLLALTCGLRRGEILALRWHNVDLDNATLTVSESMEQTKEGIRAKAPKGERGRVIDLSEMTVTELRKHRTKQEADFDLLGTTLRRDSYVYAYEDGTPVTPKALSGTWERWSGNRGVRFHDLRHAHATHLLASGIHPKVAQERLGHSSIAITMDTYSHVLPGLGADAAKRVGDALKAAIGSKP